MSCLDKIVGLSRKDCECHTGDRPVDYNESLSGLFLDELPGLTQNNIETSTDCGEGSIWDIMNKAIENGKRRFRTDLLTGLNKRFKARFQPFEGSIGLKQFNGVTPMTETYNGVRIESNCIKGSHMTLRSIDAYFDTTTSIDITIYRSDSDDPFVPTFTIQTEAFKKKTNVLSSPINLPLYVEGLDDFYYSIIYQLPAGVQPLNTKLACKCNNNKKRPWALWVDVEGIKTDSFSSTADLDDLGGYQWTYGLNLISQIECKKGNIICEEGHVWDFDNSEKALNIAHAIQEISGVFLINEVLARPDSAYFALNEEQMSQVGAQLAAQYQERIEYLSQNLDPTNDCFVCSDQMRRVGIKS